MPTPRNLRSDGCIPSTAWTSNKETSMSLSSRGRRVLAAAAGCLMLAASITAASAQQAGRTITVIVPYTPGSGPDILARTIAGELSRHWNQPGVVDNKPGASGNIGTQQVARAAPDGNAVLMTTNPFTNNVSLFKSIPYDPQKSFVPIVYVGVGALALALHPSVPAKSTQEFIAYAKAR